MKKGVSGLVVTAIIILLVIAGAYILFQVTKPAEKIRSSVLESEIEVVTSDGYTFYDPVEQAVSLQLRNDAEGEVEGVQVIVTFSDGSQTISYHEAPGNNQNQRYTLDMSEYSDNPPISVSVAPYTIVDGVITLGEAGAQVPMPERVEVGEFYAGAYAVNPEGDYTSGGLGGGGNDWCSSADIDRDGMVDAGDFAVMSSEWDGNCSTYNNWCNRTDLNRDTIVDSADFTILSVQWNRTDCTDGTAAGFAAVSEGNETVSESSDDDHWEIVNHDVSGSGNYYSNALYFDGYVINYSVDNDEIINFTTSDGGSGIANFDVYLIDDAELHPPYDQNSPWIEDVSALKVLPKSESGFEETYNRGLWISRPRHIRVNGTATSELTLYWNTETDELDVYFKDIDGIYRRTSRHRLGVEDLSSSIGDLEFFVNVSSPITCIDSDGGIEIYVFGVLQTSEYPNETFEDRCLPDNSSLLEYSCNLGDDIATQINCEYGCSDGVCNENPDGTYTAPGIQIGSFTEGFRNISSVYDSCIGVPYRGFLDGKTGSPRLSCRYDNLTNSIIDSSVKGWGDCSFVCLDEDVPLENNITIGEVNTVYQSQTDVTNLGAGRECVTYMSNISRGITNSGDGYYYCDYSKLTGDLTAACNGACTSLTCGYVCIDEVTNDSQLEVREYSIFNSVRVIGAERDCYGLIRDVAPLTYSLTASCSYNPVNGHLIPTVNPSGSLSCSSVCKS